MAVEKINSMFGLSVTVEFSSSWDYRIKNGDNLTKNDFVDSENDSESKEQKE